MSFKSKCFFSLRASWYVYNYSIWWLRTIIKTTKKWRQRFSLLLSLFCSCPLSFRIKLVLVSHYLRTQTYLKISVHRVMFALLGRTFEYISVVVCLTLLFSYSTHLIVYLITKLLSSLNETLMTKFAVCGSSFHVVYAI